MKILFTLMVCLFLSLALPTLSQPQCGAEAGGKSCPAGLCCSPWGYCGITNEYCGTGCQSHCTVHSTQVDEVISKQAFGRMILLPAANNDKPKLKLPFCPGKQSWPELVGKNGERAAAIIEQENPHVHAIVIERGTTVTFDYKCYRVRVWVDSQGIVVGPPPIVV